ncbi:MAG: cytochrome c [Magnetospirillum sp.]|nr:cytochrome c [Magnetospirillum sp.]
MRVIVGLIVIIIVAVLAFLFWIYSGGYDVAASRPHTPLTAWLLDTAKRQSVRARARGISPPFLAEEGMVEEGAKLFHERCEGCHGAPGVDAKPFAKHMLPQPPKLAEDVRRWTSAELFWIVRHGIRMTGMPAFGELIPEQKIWQIVAFLQQLPNLQAEQYQKMVAPPAPPPPAEAAPPAGLVLPPPPGGGLEMPAPPPAPGNPLGGG